MRIPDAFFPLINFGIKLTLRSPLHFVVSSNILLITFTGRKSGREFTTPVRYVRDGEKVRMFSSPAGKWWRNLVGGADVQLTLRGKSIACYTAVLDLGDETKLRLFGDYLTQFPGDSVYHGIKIRRGKPLPWNLLKSVLHDVVIVEAKLN